MSATSLLMDSEQLAEELAISKRTLWRWLASGKIPRPVIDGKVKRWCRDEIRAWVRHGCPVRRIWDAIWKSHKQ